MSQVTIHLNGKPVAVPAEFTIRQAAEAQGEHIPTFCFDERLKPYTSCFLCVVEVEGARGMVPACGTRVAEGMKIQTNSEKVITTRRMSLDLVLSDHAGDCIAPCEAKCPSNVDIQGYIALIASGKYEAAAKLIKEQNPLPVVCGRICPHPCESQCRRSLVDEAVAINPLKRFASEYELEHGPYLPPVGQDTGKKVSIVGGGPAGLSAAYYLRQQGHAVEIYDMMPKLGGMTRYGIPSFRLPWDKLDQEINSILDLGVKVHYGQKLGRDFSLSELQNKSDAVLLAIGAFKSKTMGVEGETLPGVIGGIDFLQDVVLNRHERVGKKAAVIGGGDTAMDCCRVALRKGYDVTLLYRRTQEEMPAADYEQHETQEEGVEFRFLTAPVSVLEKNGKAAGLRVITMELGEPDASGRRRPVPLKDSDEDLEFDLIISAIGQDPDMDCLKNETAKPELTKWSTFVYDVKTMSTSMQGVFAAGDCAWGPETVSGVEVKLVRPYEISRGRLQDLNSADWSPRWPHARRQLETTHPAEKRLANGGYAPINLGLDEAKALAEASRCIECGCNAKFTCDLRNYATEYGANEKRLAGKKRNYLEDKRHPLIKLEADKCITCGSCVRICDEVRHISALALENRGFFTKIVPSFGDALQNTGCDACGMCHDVCPTGAMALNTGKETGPWLAATTVTTCTLCHKGCSLLVHSRDGMVTKVESVVEDATNGGVICRDGRFQFRLGDLVHGAGAQVSVVEMAKAKEAFAQAAKVSVLVSGGLTLEEVYAAKKLAQAKGGGLYYLAGELRPSSKRALAKVESLSNISLLQALGAQPWHDGDSADLLISLGHRVEGAKGKKRIEITATAHGEAAARLPLASPLRREGHFLTGEGKVGALTTLVPAKGAAPTHLLAELSGDASLADLAALRQGLSKEVPSLTFKGDGLKGESGLEPKLAALAQDCWNQAVGDYMSRLGL